MHSGWLWRCPPDQLAIAQQQFQSQLQQLLQQLPTQTSLYSFIAPLAPLLGPHWQPADLTGLRELIWLGWSKAQQQQPGQNHYQVVASCTQPAPAVGLPITCDRTSSTP